MPNITTTDVTRMNKEALQSLALDPEKWAGYLNVLAEHTGRDRRRVEGGYESLDNLSSLNCAAVATSGIEDTREIMTMRDWAKIAPDATIAEGAAGVPIVASSTRGRNWWVDVAYPASALEGLEEKRYHNIPGRIDLDDDVDAECWNAAISNLRSSAWENGEHPQEHVPFDELNEDVQYVAKAHFGIKADVPASPLATGAIQTGDLDALADYCKSLKSSSQDVIVQISRSIRETRKQIMGQGVEIDAPAAKQEPAASVERTVATAPEPAPVEQAPSAPYIAEGRSFEENKAAAALSASRQAQGTGADLNGTLIP